MIRPRSRPTVASGGRAAPLQERQQIADARLAREGIGDRRIGLNRVPIASSHPRATDVARVSQLGHDAVGSALGDPHRIPDLAQAYAGVIGNAQQHSSVVREEGPARPTAARQNGGQLFPDFHFRYSGYHTK
jgi:hypothetical protein